MDYNDSKSSSRLSFTAHYTGYTWYANGLSHKAFSTLLGRVFFYNLKPYMWAADKIFNVPGLETSLLQRHIILDYLLGQAIERHGAMQILEIACGLSPRGFRFMTDNSDKNVKYFEADLPGMAKLKRKKLNEAKYSNQKHFILECDMLSTDGENCLENVVNKNLDPGIPTAIITEGLINYFDIDVIKSFWKRIFNILKSFPNGVYLCDNMPNMIDHPDYNLLKLWNLIMSLFVRGEFHMHFNSDREPEDILKGMGYNEAKVHRPEMYYDTLPISRTQKPSVISVIEAKI